MINRDKLQISNEFCSSVMGVDEYQMSKFKLWFLIPIIYFNSLRLLRRCAPRNDQLLSCHCEATIGGCGNLISLAIIFPSLGHCEHQRLP